MTAFVPDPTFYPLAENGDRGAARSAGLCRPDRPAATMLIQNRDGSRTKEPVHRGPFTNKRQDYYAAVPARLLHGENSVIDELIGFVFDTLGAWRLDVRVYDETATSGDRMENPRMHANNR